MRAAQRQVANGEIRAARRHFVAGVAYCAKKSSEVIANGELHFVLAGRRLARPTKRQ